jgi:hypothetical protein
MDAKRSTAVLLSSPAAAERCAKGTGLDSSAAAAAQSAIAVDRCYCRNDRRHDFHQAAALMTPQLQPESTLA